MIRSLDIQSTWLETLEDVTLKWYFSIIFLDRDGKSMNLKGLKSPSCQNMSKLSSRLPHQSSKANAAQRPQLKGAKRRGSGPRNGNTTAASAPRGAKSRSSPAKIP